MLQALAISLLAAAQASPPTFDTASIKPSAASANQSIGPAGDRLVATGVSLRLLVQYAYRWDSGRPFLNSQIVGVPDWGLSDRFDVQAKAGGGRPLRDASCQCIHSLPQKAALR